MSGKGGLGKTGAIDALAEWFAAHQVAVTLLDLDTENKQRESLKHFFNGSVTKVSFRGSPHLEVTTRYVGEYVGSWACTPLQRLR